MEKLFKNFSCLINKKTLSYINYFKWTVLFISGLGFTACNIERAPDLPAQPVYRDVPYLQDYAVKYYFGDELLSPGKVGTDRNGVIQVLASDRLYRPFNGYFQYPGILKPDRAYQPLSDRKISDLIIYQNQFVYLDNTAILSNAWAGKFLSKHDMPMAKIECGGKNFDFMISDGSTLSYIKDSRQLWKGDLNGETIISIKFNSITNDFLILGNNSLNTFSATNEKLKKLYEGYEFTCFEVKADGNELVLGTNQGYYEIDFLEKKPGELNNKLPWTELTSIKEVNGKLWFGSTKGAFMLRDDGKFNYYFGERWLPGNIVVDINHGPDNSILVLTNRGLGQICFKEITLEDKAMLFEKQVRERHIRYGINANVTPLENHDLSTSELRKADSDNLWTAMYLGSQLFRYLATGSEDAKQNCYESFEAMERLHTINNITGLFGRTYERRG